MENAKNEQPAGSGIQSPWFTTHEAAEYLKVSKNTLHAWRQRSKGPPWTKATTGMIFYNVNDLDLWLTEGVDVEAAGKAVQ